MPETGMLAIAALYAAVAPLWALVSLWSWVHARLWAFTPRWHQWAVPIFRTLFLLTLPLEAWLAQRPFTPTLFVLATSATLFWLAWRAHYLWRAPRPLPALDSLRYNLVYLVNLASFGLACHSFVCVVVALTMGSAFLMVREHWSRRIDVAAG